MLTVEVEKSKKFIDVTAFNGSEIIALLTISKPLFKKKTVCGDRDE